MQHILFRVNAGVTSGLGHLMRCLALAQAASKNQFSAVFLLNSEGAKLSQNRQDWIGQVHVMPEFKTDIQEIEKISDCCINHNIDVIVIDGYHFSAEYRQQLASLNYPVVCFDDMNNAGNLYADLIINGASSANQLGYALNQPDTQLCLGDSFRVLRQEFCDLQSKPIEQREYLTIVMGGSDPANLIIPLFVSLERMGFSGKLLIISGAAYPFLTQLKNHLNHTKIKVEHLHDCQQIAKWFLQTRLAISAAGGSQFELHATATPSCLLTVADNQLEATKAAVLQGWCITEDFSAIVGHNETQQRVAKVVQRVVSLWSNEAALLNMQSRALASRDSRGAQRVIEQIQTLCIANKK
ncbi:UDP-2,4-diacetamido-2,4,6-trideoxy-beta-L-altropyranose hydrolase [Aliiglaciecola sp. 3_MG-2023]|uniref:UDP-2,4-diacetamido-2,4, 6-trideoxy-beta-L-altropyranose hydrolase n=1 Tax=Aliiglaciecola sp. 3_MG-2023 TaxID=3062644 RepID=UPI0026E3A9B1|nr:UDP-2,4-diacetamido-2,4,6-trideoxy-beta-L-altropyranose hydrolase [Aliiglaciecola sp. 3_MG-2023]MDO6691746.1 UDP-2,4-diacetamido-2,4,6-trideoxy-beta-L-altropyranose hydrolase [Aliiglaciecola sp. 3_MG-2023]